MSDPQDIIKQYGADIIRLWVAASDYTVDVHTSNAIFKQLSESYRKIRNTVRILLANLNDFDPKRDMVPVDQLADLDKWALSRLNNLVRDARASYDRYQFHIVYHDIHNFCSIDLLSSISISRRTDFIARQRTRYPAVRRRRLCTL